jgi:hypothetical protein
VTIAIASLSGTVIISLGKNISPLGSKTFKSKEFKVVGTGSRYLNESNSERICSHFYPLNPRPIYSGCGRTAFYFSCLFLAYIACFKITPKLQHVVFIEAV